MVKLIQKKSQLLQERAISSQENIAFVPTMGNLHAGHISLLEEALKKYDTVYFSIFVNPKQFGPSEDYNRYPRTLEQDLELIQKLNLHYPHSNIIIYAPDSPEEVFYKDDHQIISVPGLNSILEGKIRPGHFDGVTTVVYRLFKLIQPNSAYFGLKDYQQYLIIKKMVEDLQLPIKIIGMPIIREESGLALSSRNQYLSDEQKKSSLVLFKSLCELRQIIDFQSSNLEIAQNYIKEKLKDQNWNYLEIRDAYTLSEDVSNSKTISILGVYQMGSTRLLDNIQLELK